MSPMVYAIPLAPQVVNPYLTMMHGLEETIISFSWQYALLTYMEQYKHDPSNLDVLYDDLYDVLEQHFLHFDKGVYYRIGDDEIRWSQYINGMHQRAIKSIPPIAEYLQFTLLRGVNPHGNFYMGYEGFNKTSCVIYLSQYREIY